MKHLPDIAPPQFISYIDVDPTGEWPIDATLEFSGIDAFQGVYEAVRTVGQQPGIAKDMRNRLDRAEAGETVELGYYGEAARQLRRTIAQVAGGEYDLRVTSDQRVAMLALHRTAPDLMQAQVSNALAEIAVLPRSSARHRAQSDRGRMNRGAA